MRVQHDRAQLIRISEYLLRVVYLLFLFQNCEQLLYGRVVQGKYPLGLRAGQKSPRLFAIFVNQYLLVQFIRQVVHAPFFFEPLLQLLFRIRVLARRRGCHVNGNLFWLLVLRGVASEQLIAVANVFL